MVTIIVCNVTVGACSSDGSLMLHRVHDETSGTVLAPASQVGKTCVHFSPLDGEVASSAEDGSLHVWNTTTCQSQSSYSVLHQAGSPSAAEMDAPSKI